MTTAIPFIHISTDPDCWGHNAEDFDCVTEAQRIRATAEFAGIDVAFDVDRRAFQHAGDGSERREIEWFDKWCSEGHAWTDDEWVAWFETFAPA